MTRSSAGTGRPWPSLFEVVIQSEFRAPGCTVSSRPYLWSSSTRGVPVKLPAADIEMPVRCCLSNEVLVSIPLDVAQSAEPPSPAFQVHSASPDRS